MSYRYNMDSISVQNFLDSCQTGDLLLYTSTHWYSRAIEWASNSKYSHISFILRDPTYIDPSLKGLYILESSKEQIPDAVTGKMVYGVQVVPLQPILNQYKNTYCGYLYYRKLSCQKDAEFYNKILTSFNKVEGKPYDLNPIDWIKADIGSQEGKTQKTNTFWCSALIGYLYSKLGFLDENIPWTLLAPRRFSYYENERLTYYNCNLDPEKYIVFNK